MENTTTNPALPNPKKRTPRFVRVIMLIALLAIVIYGVFFGVTRFWAVGDKQTAGELQSFGSDGRMIITYEGTLLTQELISDPTNGLSTRVMKFSADKGNDTLIQFMNNHVGKKVNVWYRKYSQPFLFRGKSIYYVYRAEMVR
ncbi:MAG: hypothetical protein JNL57_06405 [Bacteroidetes bacterium]|nr:hypothetical protein [Bacteroidota bacterium]